jgi:lipoic acid synthetase
MKKQIPVWVKKRVSFNESYKNTLSLINNLSINTVCVSAVCPNIYECFCKNYASFMILGNKCTRNCKFCGVDHTFPENCEIDTDEPFKILEAVKTLGMKYVVITSPTRDDLPDKGASQFAIVTKTLKESIPSVKVEVLIPDFQGDKKSLEIVAKSQPDIISHNIETIERLYSPIRPTSNFNTSISILKEISNLGFIAKSGFMLGLGEREDEIIELMHKIKDTGCDYLIIGQYLKPSKVAFKVEEYIHPDTFKKYEIIGKQIGFKNVFAGTFYRSSYLAEKLVINH